MIDLIIPFYNEEENLDKLMGSICAQTKERAFMVTCVNDHSTDKSIEILERWKQFVHFPMQIITPPEKLKYPGLVRQYGIEHTKNEYIMFCDGDDELMPQAVEYLNLAAKTKEPDVIVSHFTVEGDVEDREQGIMNGGMTWLHGNLYKRTFLEENGIHFQTGYNEDGTFNLWCLLSTDNIFECDKNTYLWKNNKKSITRTQECFARDSFEDICWGYQNIYKRFLEKHEGLMKKEELTEEEEKIVKKYWTNCVGHLGLFYKWINEFCIYNTDNDRLTEILEKMSDFVDTTKLRPLMNSSELSDFYKSVFLKPSVGRIVYVTPNDFLNVFAIKCDLRPKKIIEKFGGDLS